MRASLTKNSTMPHDLTGWIHTLAAVLALITGTLILRNAKGTRQHKRTGRVYALSMFVVCATSFMIYRVHGTFGILHLFALLSTMTLIFGMLPLYRKSFYKNPRITHLAWMYWSVIGLYSAFVAEVLTRLPILFKIEESYGLFYALVGLSAGLVGMLGARFFRKYKGQWIARFG